MTNKRIAFVNSSNSWGGLEMNVCRLALWLQEVSDSVTIFCLEESPLYNEAIKQNIKTEIIKQHNKYFDIKKAFRLSKLLAKNNIDVLFICDNKDLSLGVIAKKFTNNKVKLIFQQQMLIVSNKKDIFHRWHHACIDKWISPLELLKRQVIKHTTIKADKIAVIPLCVDIKSLLNDVNSTTTTKESLQVNSAAVLFGIVGRIDKLKGQHFVVKALQKLRQEGYNVELLIAGVPTKEKEGEEYYLYVKQLVSDLDLQDSVHFLPFFDNIGQVYSAIDIFVLSSQNETFGMVTIEAMLFGKPIIATNAGGTTEILNNGELGLLYESWNMDEFLACARNYLVHSELQELYGKKAKEVATQKYSHKVEVEQIIQLINELN